MRRRDAISKFFEMCRRTAAAAKQYHNQMKPQNVEHCADIKRRAALSLLGFVSKHRHNVTFLAFFTDQTFKETLIIKIRF